MESTQTQQCSRSSKCFPDETAVESIRAIIKRGNDAEIRRRGDGYIVLEVTKKIKYST